MKNLSKLLAIGLLGISVAACDSVDPGHVGVKVNRTGSNAGVESKPVGVGWYLATFGTNYYSYPIFTNNYAWTNGVSCSGEGDSQTCEGKNEEFSFQDKNGLVVQADVAIAYRVDPVKAPILYQTYRLDMDGLIAGPLRNAVRDALVGAASTLTVEEIYGPKKTVLINAARETMRRFFEPKGLHVEQLFWAGPVRIPQNILDSINMRAKNEQQAIAAQANVATIEAEARAKVAEANGDAESTKVKAIAEAEAIRIRSEALANNPKIVAYEWVQKWNGEMPSTVYCNSATPCVQAGQ